MMDATVRKQTGFKNQWLNKFSCKNGQVVFSSSASPNAHS